MQFQRSTLESLNKECFSRISLRSWLFRNWLGAPVTLQTPSAACLQLAACSWFDTLRPKISRVPLEPLEQISNMGTYFLVLLLLMCWWTSLSSSCLAGQFLNITSNKCRSCSRGKFTNVTGSIECNVSCRRHLRQYDKTCYRMRLTRYFVI